MRSRLLALSLVALSGAAAAQTPAFGPEFQVNVSSTGNQSDSAVAVAFGGAFAVVWQSDAPPDGENIFARTFDPFGAPRTGEFLVNSFVTDRQRHPDVASYGQAGFVVVWDSDGQETAADSHTGIYGQRFAAFGTFTGSEFHVNSTEQDFQFVPAVDTNKGTGDFVVAWTGSQGGPYHQGFDYPSVPRGSESQPLSGPLASSADIAEAVFGYFVVVWHEGGGRDGSGTGIFAQAFDDAGLPLAPAFQVNTYTTGDQLFPQVVAGGTGFVVVWSSEGQDGSGRGVYGRRFNFLPAPEGAEFLVTTDTAGDQSSPAIAADYLRRFVVVWAQPSGIFGQRFDERGRRVGGQFQMDATGHNQSLPAIGMDDSGAGAFVVAWQRDAGERAGGDGDGYAVIARRFQFRSALPMRVDEPGASLVRAPRSSNGNGVLEPEETVSVVPRWTNNLPVTQAFTGSASLGGPAGGSYTLDDSAADYGSIDTGSTADCLAATGNCYQMTVSGSPRPATHWDGSFLENLSVGFAKTWALHVGGSFTDVPATNPFYRKIETLLHEGITAGCTATEYCPSETVNRGQMSLFVARAMTGHPVAIPQQGSLGAGAYDCASGGVSLFTDVQPTDIFCRSVHYIASRNVTLGCATGKYCPGDPVTRTQMAAFVAKAIPPPPMTVTVPIVYGPDPVTGRSYDCRQEQTTNTFFTDVPAADPFCKHVHFLWARGIIAGCGGSLYCGNDPVTREAMAKFLSNAFELQLYGP